MDREKTRKSRKTMNDWTLGGAPNIDPEYVRRVLENVQKEDRTPDVHQRLEQLFDQNRRLISERTYLADRVKSLERQLKDLSSNLAEFQKVYDQLKYRSEHPAPGIPVLLWGLASSVMEGDQGGKGISGRSHAAPTWFGPAGTGRGV
jgi:hypothetical protein